jgi:arylsulfatase A-like enzyme
MRKFAPSTEYVSCEDIAVMKDEKGLKKSQLLYEDMIYFNDHHIGALMEELRRMGLYEDMLFILTGDHGEAFGEHGVTSHGKVPHDEQIRIPLMMRFPSSRFSGVVSSIVQHIDIVPTLLDYLKVVDGSMQVQGKSIMPTLRDHLSVNEYTFAEYKLKSHFPSYISVRTDDYKYIAARRPEPLLARRIRERMKLGPSTSFHYKPAYLYHLKTDPEEKENLIHAEKVRANDFHAVVKSFFCDNRKMTKQLERKKTKQENQRTENRPDEEVSKQLKALGYFD